MARGDELHSLTSLDLDDLLRRLGQDVRSAALPLGPGSDRRIGIAWIRSHWALLKATLCGSKLSKALTRDSESENEIRDAAALIDVALSPVLAKAGIAAPTVTVAVIIAKYGVGRLCADEVFEP